MTKHISEAFVMTPDAELIASTLCDTLREYTLSTVANRIDRVLNFADGKATIEPRACGVHLRVEAEDLATFFGIRVLIHVGLCQAPSKRTWHLEWHPANDRSCELVGRRSGTRRC